MDEKERKTILQNLPSLVEGVSFDELFNQLRSKNMFNQYMEREIMSAEESKKLEFLYWYVTTRGPYAFEHLVNALKETNHNDLAALLTSPSVGRPGGTIPFLNGTASNQQSLDEEFPFDQEWIVVKTSEILEFDRIRVYRMSSLPKGMALIINNRCFVNNVLEEREGSENDIARLKSILDQLGFEVIVEEELTALEIKKKVQDFSKHKKHSECDSAIVIIMSHGQEDETSKALKIAGTDYKFVTEREITDLLSAKLCEDLRGKPKMFFFQVCSGSD